MRAGAGNIARTEAFLMGCAKAIRARGIKLVFNAGEVFAEPSGVCIGCCVTHAQDHIPASELKKLGEMALPDDDDEADRAWDAIEAGFDGLDQERGIELHGVPHLWEWWNLGMKLRWRLRPDDAAKLERRGQPRRGGS